MVDQQRIQELLSAIPYLSEPPEDQVTTIGLCVREFLKPFSDTMEVDAGFGMGEAHLDFWMDGKAVRIAIKRVPGLDELAPSTG